MSVKFDVAASPGTYLVSTGAAAKTLPDGDWVIGVAVAINSLTAPTSGQPQYLVSTGPYNTAGSFNLVFEPTAAASAENHLHLFLGASTTPFCQNGGALVQDGKYYFFWQRSAGVISAYHCPILSAAPTDGSAVIAGGTTTISGALVGTGNFTFGNRSDLAGNRIFGQSAARLIRLDGATLTTLEMAKLAYGMNLSDLGKTPAIYIRADDASDLADRGAQANTFSATPSTLVTGTPMGFGYVATTPAAPVISGVPVIANGATVGSASSVNSAAVTGVPTPTTTFQWKLDGVSASGATGATFTPAAGDTGKTLAVVQTSTNSQGTATATSAGVVVAAAATGTITAVELAAERIYQRISGAAVVALSGGWTGGTQPASIEYQLYAPDGVTVQKAWASTGATIVAGNTWTAAPSIPQPTNGKKYLIQYRSKDSGGNVLATSAIKANRFGVGDGYGFIGSSSAEKSFTSDSGYGFTADSDATSKYDGTWATIGTTGCAVLIASSLAVQAGVPIALYDYGIGGSVLTDWNTSGYAQWNDFANGVTSQGGKLAGTLITVGSNDAAYGQVASRAAHATNLRTLIARVRTLTGQASLPTCLIGFNRRTSYNVSAASYATCADYVRMAESDVGDDAGVYSIQTLDFLLSSDGIHLAFVDTGFPAWGRRIAYVFGAAIYSSTYRRGPKITQMSLSGNVVTVTLAHRGSSDFTPTSGITGFTALDSAGAAIAISSAARTSATTIVLTCASAPAKVQYLEGGAPEVGTPVFGNTATALPMTVETDMTLAAQLATTVNFSVVDAAGANVTGLVNLDYAFYDQPRISAGAAPVKYGTTVSVTNGVGSISIAGVTTLAPGGVGRIEFGDSALVKAAIGQATVS